MGFRVASARYRFVAPDSFAAYAAAVAEYAERAADGGAKLLLFPEYGSLDLVCAAGAAGKSLREQLKSLDPLLGEFTALYAALARKHGLLIAAPTFPVCAGEVWFNRCHLLGPDGGIGFQDKLNLTPYEFNRALFVPGVVPKLFETPLGKLAVAVCYDAEFPMTVRNYAERGVEILLVPSCTDTEAGATRIRVAAAARALESRCLVLTSTTEGEVPWCDLVDVNKGEPAAFAPPDKPFPVSGVLASMGAGSEERLLFANLEPEALGEEGDVDLKRRDWERQRGRVEIAGLS